MCGGEETEIKFLQEPMTVSLLSMTKICAGVTTKNLHWELDDATLTQSFPNATSNRADSEEIFIKVGSFMCGGEEIFTRVAGCVAFADDENLRGRHD